MERLWIFLVPKADGVYLLSLSKTSFLYLFSLMRVVHIAVHGTSQWI